MNIDSLKQHWQAQLDVSGRFDPEQLLAVTKQRSRKFNRAARQRSLIGISMFLLPLPLIVFLFFVFPGNGSTLHVVGAAILLFLLCCAGLIAFTGIFRQTTSQASDRNVETFLTLQLGRIERQAWLFRHIVWWFWMPLLVGDAILALIMAFTSLIPVNQFDLISVALVPALAVYGIAYARKFMAREIHPWQREFNDCLQALHDQGTHN